MSDEEHLLIDDQSSLEVGSNIDTPSYSGVSTLDPFHTHETKSQLMDLQTTGAIRRFTLLTATTAFICVLATVLHSQVTNADVCSSPMLARVASQLLSGLLAILLNFFVTRGFQAMLTDQFKDDVIFGTALFTLSVMVAFFVAVLHFDVEGACGNA